MIPDVSIIIAHYDYERYLLRCLRSCLKQRYVTHEIVLVDDASPNKLWKDSLFPFCEDERVRVIELEQNVGVAAASNRGITHARGQFIVRVDADDFVSDDFCYILKRSLELNHDAFGVGCDCLLVDEMENVVGRRDAQKEPFSCGIMYRRDLFLRLGGYDDRMRHREEEELRARLGEEYKIRYLPLPLYRYRMHGKNKTLSREYAETVVK